MTELEKLYKILLEDGFTIEQAKSIIDYVEYDNYTVDSAIDKVLGIN